MDVLCMNQPIQMISCCDTTGHITPMRFRMREKDEIVTLNVDRILCENSHGPRIYDGYFTCQVSYEYGVKEVELRYHYATHRWYLESIKERA